MVSDRAGASSHPRRSLLPCKARLPGRRHSSHADVTRAATVHVHVLWDDAVMWPLEVSGPSEDHGGCQSGRLCRPGLARGGAGPGDSGGPTELPVRSPACLAPARYAGFLQGFLLLFSQVSGAISSTVAGVLISQVRSNVPAKTCVRRGLSRPPGGVRPRASWSLLPMTQPDPHES